MAVVPPSNLAPDSQPWGRHVTDRVRTLDQDLRSLKNDNVNAFRGVNSALNNLGEQLMALQQQNALIIAQQEQINSAVNALASRITVSSTAPPFNTGTIPITPDMIWYTGNQASLTLNVPTGKMLITVMVGEASLSGGASSMGAAVSYSVPTAGIVVGGPEGRNFTTGEAMGSPLVVSRVVNVTPGVHTVNGVCGAYAYASGMSVNFMTPVLTVQVIV